MELESLDRLDMSMEVMVAFLQMDEENLDLLGKSVEMLTFLQMKVESLDVENLMFLQMKVEDLDVEILAFLQMLPQGLRLPSRSPY